MINVGYLWAGVGFLTGLSVKTAFSREAATAGTSAHTTYGRENHSKPKHFERKKWDMQKTSPLVRCSQLAPFILHIHDANPSLTSPGFAESRLLWVHIRFS